MGLAALQQEKAQIAAEIAAWQQRLQQAQLEIAAWTGHQQRVDIWITRLEEQQHVDAQQWAVAPEIERVPAAE